MRNGARFMLGWVGGLALSACGVHHHGIPTGSGPAGAGGMGGGTALDLSGGEAPGGGGSGGTSGGGSDAGMSSDASDCGKQTFTLERRAADLLLVQDRSGSMNADVSGNRNGTPSKWSLITSAINQVVSKSSSIYWAIAQAIKDTHPANGTPTAQAVKAGVAYYQATGDGRSHYMLLATDGIPGCDGANDVKDAEDAVAAAAQAGIKTIVVGIGQDPEADSTLTHMATSGGMPNQKGPKAYYQVETSDELVKVLESVAGQIVSCSYALAAAPPDPSQVSVTLDGTDVARDKSHAGGWDLGASNLSIEFYGAACDALKAVSAANLQVVFGCPPIS